jgi:hypothetical protein
VHRDRFRRGAEAEASAAAAAISRNTPQVMHRPVHDAAASEAVRGVCHHSRGFIHRQHVFVLVQHRQRRRIRSQRDVAELVSDEARDRLEVD